MIFISHETSSSGEWAELMVEYLEKEGLQCWFAPKTLVQNYTEAIDEAIQKCDIFILLLNKSSTSNENVLTECEIAHQKRAKTKNITFIPIFLEKFEVDKKMRYYIVRDQYMEAFGKRRFDFLEELVKRVKQIKEGKLSENESMGYTLEESQPLIEYSDIDDIFNEKETSIYEGIKEGNRYYNVDDKLEGRRLQIEAELLYPFEKDIYDRLLEGRKNQNVLISSCMSAPVIMNRLGHRHQVSKILGLCYNEQAVKDANDLYQTDKTKFFHQDCEDVMFKRNLRQYIDEMGIDKFDVIDITMGFLDWKNPFDVLTNLKYFARSGCRIFIRDVDDGVVFAYPDKNGLWKKFFKLYKLNPYAGNRESARRIYGMLRRLDINKIKIEKSGIDTADMNKHDELARMFISWTRFMPNDFSIACNAEPDNKKFRDAKEWIDNNYSKLKDSFFERGFIFNSGYFLITAEIDEEEADLLEGMM